MLNIFVKAHVSAPSGTARTSTGSSDNEYLIITASPNTRKVSESQNKKIESAVYSHIKALRALGRTNVNSLEIAEALGLSIQAVHRVIDQLKKKGVRKA